MSNALTFGIAGLVTAGVLIRPYRWPEAVWAVAGALLLVALGLLPLTSAWHGVLAGLDVYCFLAGMMLLSEVAREEGLFDWLAALATELAHGSARRLFLLVYLVGVVVTVFMSNDATAVVLTPAVYAATQAARVSNPKPYLLICAFIANAASFVLPISNPANLVVFGGGRMPPLLPWLAVFAVPSLVCILVTYTALRLVVRHELRAETIAADPHRPHLSLAAQVAAGGIALTAVVLLVASALGIDLGLPTLIAGTVTALVVVTLERHSPIYLLRQISWSVLPLVAGLFVLVEALDGTGVTHWLAGLLRGTSDTSGAAAAIWGGAVALVSNIINNLPTGLFAARALQHADAVPPLTSAVLIGIDVGPNLSVTGSLATILWLTALRREGEEMSGLEFLRVGALVMLPSLAATLVVLMLLA